MLKRQYSSDSLQRQESLLNKIEQQFERLDSELDGLETAMIQSGWMPDPVAERKAARAAAQAARAASQGSDEPATEATPTAPSPTVTSTDRPRQPR